MAIDSRILTNDRTLARTVQLADLERHAGLANYASATPMPARPPPPAQVAAAPSAASMAWRPPPAFPPAQTSAPGATPYDANKESKLRAFRFQLASLQREQRNLEERAAALEAQVLHNANRANNVSTAASDFQLTLDRLRKVGADIEQMNEKIRAAESQ
jgi:septal ring factor EnvC (AmiA/AmiB activator)